jgi:hypothetical protein
MSFSSSSRSGYGLGFRYMKLLSGVIKRLGFSSLIPFQTEIIKKFLARCLGGALHPNVFNCYPEPYEPS